MTDFQFLRLIYLYTKMTSFLSGMQSRNKIKLQKNNFSILCWDVENELRSLTRGKKLLHRLAVQPWILMYPVADGRRVTCL